MRVQSFVVSLITKLLTFLFLSIICIYIHFKRLLRNMKHAVNICYSLLLVAFDLFSYTQPNYRHIVEGVGHCSYIYTYFESARSCLKFRFKLGGTDWLSFRRYYVDSVARHTIRAVLH